MLNRRRRSALLLLLSVVAVVPIAALGGCWFLVGAAGAGAGVAYAKGDLEGIVDADVESVAAATGRALEELDLTVVSTKSSKIDGEVVARTAGDEKITVRLSEEGEQRTKVRIRIGVFGDETLSRRIYDTIRAHASG
jgi:hypothetical protein